MFGSRMISQNGREEEVHRHSIIFVIHVILASELADP